MHRRAFLQLSAVGPVAAFDAVSPDTPRYTLVSRYKATPRKDIPGSVVSVKANASIDTATKVNAGVVNSMVARGMCELTGEKTELAAWKQFFSPSDVVGIKVNCSGAPKMNSSPEVVAAIVRNLTALGVKPQQIYIYERFPDQLESVGYGRYVDAGVNIKAIEMSRRSIAGYDPATYVEVNFFGEEDTRSNLIRLVSETFTKIINVPNMKDHGAAGVTGCLKNIAYGNYSNVARSHSHEKTNTKTFIGTLAAMEPLKSKTVLHIMDGLKGVWQGGPFLRDPRFQFFPKQMMFGTDAVAIDRLLIDIIENKRKAEGAPSVWDRSPANLNTNGNKDPMKNAFIREPGHIEYAAGLGLGTYDRSRIRLKEIEL
jgi:uncharacterized protein (DUF362 family)